MLDVVLGYGAHPDPAGELAPAIARAKAIAEKDGRYLDVVAVVCGTDEDPQGLAGQIEQLEAVGVWVNTSNDAVVRYVGRLARALSPDASEPVMGALKPVNLDVLNKPLTAINVGLESFVESLAAQQARAVHVDWRPAAGGNEKLMSILERMRTSG
jgi:FdrA protein